MMMSYAYHEYRIFKDNSQSTPISKYQKIASQMPKLHSLQASGKHNEIVTLGHKILSVAMLIVVGRLKPKVNETSADKRLISPDRIMLFF